ncbi:MAG: alpha/beta hydrolase fold domain-containing protein [Planctomycetota bacterium]
MSAALTMGPPPAEAAPQKYEVARGEVYAQVDGRDLLADVYSPSGKGPFPAVLCLHGGAWAAGHRSHMGGVARRLAEGGFVAITIDYRLAPRYKYPAQYEDCQKALEWIRSSAERLRIAPERIAAWGYSAGGHLALLLGTHGSNLFAVVAGGAPADLREIPEDNAVLAFWLGGTRRDKPEVYLDASPATHVTPDDPPVFLYHGETDMLVPYQIAKNMKSLLEANKVPGVLHTVRAAGHVLTFINADATAEGVRFLQRQQRALAAEARQTGDDR